MFLLVCILDQFVFLLLLALTNQLLLIEDYRKCSTGLTVNTKYTYLFWITQWLFSPNHTLQLYTTVFQLLIANQMIVLIVVSRITNHHIIQMYACRNTQMIISIGFCFTSSCLLLCSLSVTSNNNWYSTIQTKNLFNSLLQNHTWFCFWGICWQRTWLLQDTHWLGFGGWCSKFLWIFPLSASKCRINQTALLSSHSVLSGSL